MATLTFTHDNITLTSAWRTTTGSNGKPQYLQSPTLVYANPTFNVTGIPNNAVINSAKVYFTWGAPSFTDVSALFFTYNNERTNMTKNSTAEIPISITGNGEVKGSVGFRALGWLNRNYIGYYTCNITATDVKLVVEYTIPYTAPSAPTSVFVASTNVAPGASVQLSWSGAAAGTNNAITAFSVYRATSASGSYSWLASVSTSATSGSTNVIAPTTNGSSYYYKVVTIGTIDDYKYSPHSTAYATLTCSCSATTAPTSVNVAANPIDAGTSTTLSWSGAKAGTNNAIAGYEIYRATSASGTYSKLTSVSSTATSGSTSVAAPSTMGSSYYYKVLTVGKYTAYNSGQSSTYATLTAKTYTACGAPTSVSLASNNVAPGASVKLSWSGATAGTNNAITGYHIYRATSSNGTYTHTYTVNTTATSGSYNVTAQTANNSTYYYRVYTIGTKNGYNSGASSVVSLTTKYTDPGAPTSLTINDASSVYIGEGQTATLKWSGASAGTNNPIASYLIYVDEALYGETPSTQSSVAIPSYNGGEHKWKIITKGTYSNSPASSTVSCFTYTATGAPTSVSLAASVVDARASTTLSWSGAKAGTYNAITGYHVYRATSENGAYSVLTAVESTSTAANTTVNAPSTMGNKYYYKVYTIGARNYNSVASSAVSLTAQTYTVPGTPTNLSLSANNVAVNASVTLSWSGAAAGTNNPITAYKIYRSDAEDGTYTLLTTVSSTATSGSTTVSAPASTSSAFYYKIITVGTKSGFTNSAYSSVIALRTESAQPTPPTSVSVSKPYIYQTSERITLSWSGALGGDGTITGYNIYRASSRNSTYTKLATVSTTETSGSYTASFTEAATTYYFKISTVGGLGESAMSASASVIFHTFPSAPTNVMVSKTLSDGEAVTLSWDAATPGYQDSIKEYWVNRRESTDGQTWGELKGVTTTSETMVAVLPPETYGNYYRYEVTAQAAHGAVSNRAAASNTLRRNHAPIVFAEDITAGQTNVRAQHMTELQDTIAMLLDFYGLDAQATSTITAGETKLSSWTSHVNEIRAAIDFLTTYHDAWLDIPVNTPRADVMNQLRNVLLYVASPECVLGVAKLGAMITR